MSPSLLDFLEHILHECSYIIRVKEGKTREQVFNDETLSKAIVRSLEIIGEATKKLPPDFKSQHPGISWVAMAGMRDVLIHQYFGIDYDVVWNTINRNIPALRDELEEIVETERGKK
jgi:uncharacterized protein with HEPN domain